jgi:hypothetical protein
VVDERKPKKAYYACDPPTSITVSGTIPEISSILSSPSATAVHRALKLRCQHHHSQAKLLCPDARYALTKFPLALIFNQSIIPLDFPSVAGLESIAMKREMEEEVGASNEIRLTHYDDADWSSFLPKLLRLIFIATTRRYSSSIFIACERAFPL